MESPFDPTQEPGYDPTDVGPEFDPADADFDPNSLFAFATYMVRSRDSWITRDTYYATFEAYGVLYFNDDFEDPACTDEDRDALYEAYLEDGSFPEDATEWPQWAPVRSVKASVLAERALNRYQPLGLGGRTLSTYCSNIRWLTREFFDSRPTSTTMADLRTFLESDLGLQAPKIRSAWKRLVEPLRLSDEARVSLIGWEIHFDTVVEEDRKNWAKKVAEYQRLLEFAFQKFLAWTATHRYEAAPEPPAEPSTVEPTVADLTRFLWETYPDGATAVRVADLVPQWESWCQQQGIQPRNMTWLGSNLSRCRWAVRQASGRRWRIQPAPENQPTADQPVQ